MFADILLNRLPPPPSLGEGRVYRAEEEIPSDDKRRSDILAAIRSGCTDYLSVSDALSFNLPQGLLVADCEELAERNLIEIIREKGKPLRFTLMYPTPSDLQERGKYQVKISQERV